MSTRAVATLNGILRSAFRPSETTTRNGPLRLLFVGHWRDTRKGLPMLLDACARLEVPWTLDVVGDGGRAPRVEMAGVHYHGPINSEERLAAMYAACVPPGSPGALAEALCELARDPAARLRLAPSAATACARSSGIASPAVSAPSTSLPSGRAAGVGSLGHVRRVGHRGMSGRRLLSRRKFTCDPDDVNIPVQFTSATALAAHKYRTSSEK